MGIDMICLIVYAAILGLAVAGETSYCTNSQKNVDSVDGGGGLGGYYVRPLPGNCRGRHGNIANWKPTFKVNNPVSRCPGGWKKYKGACYYDRRQQGHLSYRQGEDWCNQHQAHIFVPNNREEYLWVEQQVMTHNEWYFMGFFCAKSGTRDMNQVYSNTRENVPEIQKKLNVQLAHPIDEHNTPCMMSHRNNNSWRWQYHHQHGHEGRGIVCEAPTG